MAWEMVERRLTELVFTANLYKEMYAPLLDVSQVSASSRGVEVFDEATGWTRVDRSMGEARTILEEA